MLLDLSDRVLPKGTAGEPSLRFHSEFGPTGLWLDETGGVPAAVLQVGGVSALRVTQAGATILGQKAWHEGNDGAGSGLDADRLDGLEATAFALAAHEHAGYLADAQCLHRLWSASDTDVDGLLPGTNYGSILEARFQAHFVIGIRSNDINDSFAVVSKEAGNSTYTRLVFRALANGELLAGSNKIWHEGNDGAGSGLDADRLAGQESGYFLNTSAGAQTKAGNLAIGGSISAGTSITGSSLWASHADPRLVLFEADGSPGNKRWDFVVQNEVLYARLYDDAGGTPLNWLSVTRTGSTPGDLTFRAGSSTGLKVIVGGTAHNVWHAGNHGAGSGLNADLLDGQDGSCFLNPANHLLPDSGAIELYGSRRPLASALDTLADVLAFATIQQVEYWDYGTEAWTSGSSFASSLQALLTGRLDGALTLAAAQRRFRFVFSTATFLGEILVLVAQAWNSGAHQLTIQVERAPASSGSWTTVINATSPAGEDNYRFFARAVSHAGEAWYRLTITSADVVNGTTYTGMRFLSSYVRGGVGSGTPTLPFSWNQQRQIISPVTTGTAPFVLSSSTLVANLNADLVDGRHASEFLDTGTGTQAKAGPLHLGGEIVPSAAFLQVRGISRMGAIYLHAGSPPDNSRTSDYLSNNAGDLLWAKAGNAAIVWTAGNDGQNSGLDADLLDGQHGSYYATAAHNHAGVYEPVFAKGSLIPGNNVTLIGNLSNRLVGPGDVTIIASGGGGSGGVTAHSELTGLENDDHLQYLNNTRGDARYFRPSVGGTIAANTTFASNLTVQGSLSLWAEQGGTATYVPVWTSSPGSVAVLYSRTIASFKADLQIAAGDVSGLGAAALLAVGTSAGTVAAGNHLHDSRYLQLSGGTVTGTLSFGSVTRQMLELYGTSYALGVQSSSAYLRTAEAFYVHRLGSHSNTKGAPGSGGTVMLALEFTGSVFTAFGFKVWTEGNDGAGTGLDADLLDGKHASEFALAGHNHSGTYEAAFDKGSLVAGTGVSLGGTLTGRLVGSGNVTINATGGDGRWATVTFTGAGNVTGAQSSVSGAVGVTFDSGTQLLRLQFASVPSANHWRVEVYEKTDGASMTSASVHSTTGTYVYVRIEYTSATAYPVAGKVYRLVLFQE